MGWNLSLVHAKGPAASADTFASAHEYRPALDVTGSTFEELVLGPDDDRWDRPTVAIGETPVGLVIAARLIVTDQWAVTLSARGGSASWAVWQSVTGSYGFTHVADGRVVREVHRRDQQTTHTEGPALPAEALLRRADPTRQPDDEDDLFALVGGVTGLPAPDQWLSGPAQAYTPIPPTELAPLAKPRRRLFGR